MYTDYILHHGIKGQKWGIRRTPEQLGHKTKKKRSGVKAKLQSLKPGSSTKKKQSASSVEKVSSEKTLAKKSNKDLNAKEREAKKQQVLESRSAKQLYDNADLFTTQELQNAYNRLNLERSIKNLTPKQVSKGQQYLDKYVKTANNVSAFLKSTNAVIGQASAMYNMLNKLSGGSSKKKGASSESSNKPSNSNSNSPDREQRKNKGTGKKPKTKSDTQKEDTPTYEVPRDSNKRNRGEDFTRTVEDVVLDVISTRRGGNSVNFEKGMDYVADVMNSLPDNTTVRGLLESGEDDRRR